VWCCGSGGGDGCLSNKCPGPCGNPAQAASVRRRRQRKKKKREGEEEEERRKGKK
jgi:hypothetical protein